MLVVDGHCDTIQVALDRNVDLEDKNLNFNLEEAQEGVPILQMMAAFINPSCLNYFQRACDIIQYFESQIKKYPKDLIHVKTKEDIPKDQIFNVMREINQICAQAPVAIGDVLLKDVAGTGVDIVATKAVPAKRV